MSMTLQFEHTKADGTAKRTSMFVSKLDRVAACASLLNRNGHHNVLVCGQRKLPDPSNRLLVELLDESPIANLWTCNVWFIGEPAGGEKHPMPEPTLAACESRSRCRACPG